MAMIGGSRLTVNVILISEIVCVLLTSAALAAGLTIVAGCYAADVIRLFL
jgi:hypothetical protein